MAEWLGYVYLRTSKGMYKLSYIDVPEIATSYTTGTPTISRQPNIDTSTFAIKEREDNTTTLYDAVVPFSITYENETIYMINVNNQYYLSENPSLIGTPGTNYIKFMIALSSPIPQNNLFSFCEMFIGKCANGEYRLYHNIGSPVPRADYGVAYPTNETFGFVSSSKEIVNRTVYYDQNPQRVFAEKLSRILTGAIVETIDTDPYEPGGTSGPGGGDGTFDFTSTPIDFVGAPTIGAYDTGMVNLYVPSAANLRSLSAYLWAGAFDLDNFKKLVADPMDAIIGLSILPLTAAQIGTSASTLAVGNVSTGISMPRATSQYVTVDCGSVQILPKWGAYLDFAPYSKLQLYLPYIGIVDISPDDCMNGTIAVRYTVDILSGTCYAQVKCNDHVLYNYGATCSTTCPVTSGQYQNVAFAALGAIGGIAGAVVSGMAGSVGGVTGGIENAANSVLSSFKPDISRSGGAGGSAGLMGHQIPYLILTVPRMCTPGYQNEFIGYPAYSTQTLGDLSGYTEIDSIHPAGIPCSEDELAEIVELLNGGVFL